MNNYMDLSDAELDEILRTYSKVAYIQKLIEGKKRDMEFLQFKIDKISRAIEASSKQTGSAYRRELLKNKATLIVELAYLRDWLEEEEAKSNE